MRRPGYPKGSIRDLAKRIKEPGNATEWEESFLDRALDHSDKAYSDLR